MNVNVTTGTEGMSMRPKVVAGNWKMYKNLDQTRELINGLKAKLDFDLKGTGVIICPPFTSLALASSLIQGSEIQLGAQNLHQEEEGAFTGEISAAMLVATGCKYVILGHSERRQYFKETNELINTKAKKAIALGLHPIICVGELLEEREKGITEQVVAAQVRGVLNGFTAADLGKTIIAYEPVWAIGTGKTATPDQAQAVHRFIRKIVGQAHTWGIAEKLVIQYGGSVKPDNAADLFAQPDIDGGLVGGACLKPDSFAEIVRGVNP